MTRCWAIATLVIKELFRRKDFYVLFVLVGLISLVLGSIHFYGEQGIVRYLKEISLLLIWISGLLIAVLTAARQIPAERESRTLFPLLAKPFSRGHVIAGKYLGCWTATGLTLVCFYLFFSLLSGTREHLWPWAAYFQALSLQWAMLGIIIAFAIFGSIVFAAPSSNATITIVVTLGLLVLGPHLHRMASGLAEPLRTTVEGVYFTIPHLEFFDMRTRLVHGWGAISWRVWFVAELYSVLYAAFFLLAAWLLFRKKPLN